MESRPPQEPTRRPSTNGRKPNGTAGSPTPPWIWFFLIAVVAAWEGVSLIPTLLHGYVLLAVPPVLGRLAAVICLGGPIALGFAIVRLLRREESGEETEAAGAGTAGTVAQGV